MSSWVAAQDISWGFALSLCCCVVLHAALKLQHRSWCLPSCTWSHPDLKSIFPAGYLGKSWVTNLQCRDLPFFFFFAFPLYLKILLSIEHYTTVALLWFSPHEWEIYNSASIYFDSFWDIKKISEQHLFSNMLQPMIIFFHCTNPTVLLLH